MTLTLLAPAWPAAARTAPKPPAPPPQSGQGLEISPPLLELTANPGQTLTFTIRVRNVTKQDVYATVRTDDFGAEGEDGLPKVLVDEQGTTRFSLKTWVAPVSQLRLAPQEIKTSTVTIHVPANAEPGGHYGVVRYTATPVEPNGNGVGLSASIGTLVLLKVNGDINEHLKLVEFGTLKDDSIKTAFFETGPVWFFERIQNDGSVHLPPTGSIDVYNLFGRKVASFSMNDADHNILPDSIRRFEEKDPQKMLFGHYTAKLTVQYGHGPKRMPVAAIGFWVLPWKLLLLILLLLIVLFFVLRAAIRSYNRRIIERSRRRRR